MRRSFVMMGLGMAALAGIAGADETFEYWPGVEYDDSVPTFQDVLGHEPGERIVAPENLIRYLEALAAYAPDRIRIFEYAGHVLPGNGRDRGWGPRAGVARLRRTRQ